METVRNIRIDSKAGRPLLLDLFFEAGANPKPVVIFNHGFKGFKDWGYWDLMGKELAKQGFIFIKFNQSHNGTTVENPTEFEALEAFGKNTYRREMLDIESVIDWLFNNTQLPQDFIDAGKICLMGHSRGGATAILYARRDKRIKKVISWSSFKAIEERFQHEFYHNWKEKERIYIPNARTGQAMPQDYEIYEEFKTSENDYSIEKAIQSLDIPVLVVHGTEDPTVPFEDAMVLKSWNTQANLFLVPNANHVYGGSHPWKEARLPEDAQKALNESLRFLND